jgi:hypothetical protein
MPRLRILSFVTSALLIFSLSLSGSAQADERKKSNWGAACPTVIDLTPEKPMPKTDSLVFTGSGQSFRLLQSGGTEFVSSPEGVIGCYVNEQLIEGNANNPKWQIGALNRDLAGFYFTNAQGIIWRLELSSDGTYFQTASNSLYYETGNQFRLTREILTPKDCKLEDYFMGEIRIGFPRSNLRVPSLGVTNNLILAVDFPDSQFTGGFSGNCSKILGGKFKWKAFSHLYSLSKSCQTE